MEEESRKVKKSKKGKILGSISKIRLYVYLGLGILIAVALSPLFSGHPGISKPTEPEKSPPIQVSSKMPAKQTAKPTSAYFRIVVVEDKFFVNNIEVTSSQAASMALAAKLPIEIEYSFSARTIAEEEITSALSALNLEIDRVTKLPKPQDQPPKR